MKYFFYLCCCFLLKTGSVHAQSFSESFVTTLMPSETENKPRKFSKPSTKLQKINPLFYTGASLLFVYQNLISEQLQADCGYHVSCSEAAVRGMNYYGTIKGILVGVNQLSTCLPRVYIEYPRRYITNDFKVDNSFYFTD